MGEVKELKYVKSVVVATADEIIKAAGSNMTYKVGTMIEIPRAALTADEIAKEAEFFSFGTNDLTQMTFGFSRDDAGKFLDAYYEKKIYESDPFARLDQTRRGPPHRDGCQAGPSDPPRPEVGHLRRARRRPLLRGVLPQHRAGLCVLLPLPCAHRPVGCRPGCYQEPPQVRVLSFTIGFDEAQTFYKSHGYGIKPSKWHDLTVEVYI